MSDPRMAAAEATAALSRDLRNRFDRVRRATEYLCEPLETEDYVVQTMTEASPAKWHLAHTSWFFETFVLEPGRPNYTPFHPQFRYLFNSYYNAVGPQHDRPQRGLLSRPTVREIFAYRAHVTAAVRSFLDDGKAAAVARLAPVIELGCNHEEQHQELLLTDLKHVFGASPLRPAYREADKPGDTPGSRRAAADPELGPIRWIGFEAGLREIGHRSPDGPGNSFCFDNETPLHSHFQNAFEIGHRLITNREYLEFMEDGGYARPELWLSEGWDVMHREGWNAPLYWWKEDGRWMTLTLRGYREVDPDEPVCHVSYYEADAFARWKGNRLPTEEEWEIAASSTARAGNFVESEAFHPRRLPEVSGDSKVHQLFGDTWEWTRSPYSPYPGYTPTTGALGEYNGKFMCSQMVLRGGSCATPEAHIRATYRNFFYPDARWQFTGIRLARDPEMD